MWERGKHRATGSEEPDFISIPHRANRIDNGAAFCIFFAQERQEHSNTEVKAFKEEKANP